MASVKTLPNAKDSEMALIGCCFVEPSILVEAQDLIKPQDFYDVKNKLIYDAMIELTTEGKTVDPTTVITRLTASNKLNEAGGLDYISEIAEASYSSSNFEAYIDDIYKTAMKRKAIDLLNDLAQAGYEDSDVDRYIDNVEREILGLSTRRKISSFTHVHEVTEEVERIAEFNAKNDATVIGMDTGFDSLNKITQGFQAGQLIILAARPAMGKSAFAMNLAMNIAEKNDKNVAIFSLEMSNAQLVQRMVAAQGSISIKYIQNGHLSKTDWVRFSTALNKVGNLKLYFDDSSDSTISSIRAKCRKLKSESDLGFIVIDYLQLIEYDNASQHMSQIEKITKITRSLKLMARELQCPVLCLSQLSRKVEERPDKKPIMSDLRDSGSIEQDADMVIMLYRDEYYNRASTRKGEADVILGKNRSGSTGELPFIFTGEYQRFREKVNDEENGEE